MFFIGPSVHIFVYLLVSAFFFICFYTKSETRIRENLPEEKIITLSQGTFETLSACKIVDFIKNTIHKEPEAAEFLVLKKKVLPYIINYKDPLSSSKTLRAPPAA
ncbi:MULTISPECIES: hypothetical protein [Sanguibacteroides]|uniref:Uncharacterized protein n=1 Tax=Sanguibacteroides justesenii TaxID=1547597 RepID=A0A0C3MGH3_9PORP|nr:MULTISPECIES: hypothetical protein [Sanguibacteroides]KIO43409.1 hypothetical protein IE90_09710 [Sanguibacteroides justesenii]KIO45588.1 hypothetical protein BA92_03745 [Sanguibacteroides justesenii]PXZ45317.1 hypothetical protein DMB45_02535 [Sanguibacteroides justesenii]